MQLVPAFLRPQRADVWLFLFYGAVVAGLLYCYPVPQISWDSNYYVERSMDLKPGLRPIGYAFFLRVLYSLYGHLWVISVAQLTLYFMGVRLFCGVLGEMLAWKRTWVCALSALLLLEPAGLAHCVAVLSDVLFSILTLLWVATLLLLVRRVQGVLLLLHGLILLLCLQTRHLAQCYPVISCFVLLILLWKKQRAVALLTLAGIGWVLGIWYTSNTVDRWRNFRHFGVATQTPFAGWTDANNALHALPYVRNRSLKNPDPQVQALHRQFVHFIDTTSFTPSPASSDYLWDARSPLDIMRRQYTDSLHGFYEGAWFLLAPRLGAWGSAIRNQHPGAYLRGFVVPNFASLVLPHTGEMSDYYIAGDALPGLLQRYGITQSDIRCRYQPFKSGINALEQGIHLLRLIAIVVVTALLLIRWKRAPQPYRQVLAVLLLVGAAYYGSMLLSSRIMPRYIIPILQLETAFLCTGGVLLRHFRKARVSNAS